MKRQATQLIVSVKKLTENEFEINGKLVLKENLKTEINKILFNI